MDEFVKVLVLDGCFLVELFRKLCDTELRGEDDPIFSVSCRLQFLYHDLILLENQIPWFVLNRLFNMTRRQEERHLSSLVAAFFNTCFSRRPNLELFQEEILMSLLSIEQESKHILDLLRNSMILHSSIGKVGTNPGWLTAWQPMPSVKSLQEAGIKFKEATNRPASVLDIKFADGVLEIPPLLIQESTEPLFRNIISFEQSLPNCAGIFTSYAMLLDNLINTVPDMEILCKRKVMDNWLNIDDATKLFNKLYDDTCVTDFYYLELTKDVNDYCGRRWPRYRTVLMRDYFKNPWTVISVIVAAILLIFTFLQTLFTIIK